jgi:putative FmdB family regulatory protein
LIHLHVVHQFLDNYRQINNIKCLTFYIPEKRKMTMPLYEFRCLKCNECFEILVMKQEEQVELRCPKCKSEEFERVLSVSCHTVGGETSKDGGARSQTRSCPSGTCTTYDIPGHGR